MHTVEAERTIAEQGGQPEWQLSRFLNSKPVAAARLPWSLGVIEHTTMQQPIDFLLTYPCFSPMRSRDIPCTCRAPDATNDQGVILITDSDLIDRFFAANLLPHPWLIETFSDSTQVIDFLEYHSRFFARGKRITHVVIDPGDTSKYVRWHPIEEFVRHISSNGGN